LTPPGGGTPCDIIVIYTQMESVGLFTLSSLTLRVYLHSFSRCCFPRSLNHATFRQFWPYTSSRSSKVIDLGVNRKLTCDFLLVILRPYLLPFSRYWRLKLENGWCFQPNPCLTDPFGGSPLEFLDETYPAI